MIHLFILMLTLLTLLTAPPAEATPFGGIYGFTKCLAGSGPRVQAGYWCEVQWDVDGDRRVTLADWAYFAAYPDDWP